MRGSSRIVFVAPFGLRHKTTVWARALPLAQELSRIGHRTSIIIPPWDSPADAGQSWMEGDVRIEHVEVEGGVPATSARLLRRLFAIDPDIVHIIKPRAFAGIVQWVLWQTKNIGIVKPRILLDVDDWERPWAQINGYPFYQAAFLRWQEEWGIRHAHGITSASRWLYDNVSHAAPSIPTLYLPNGVTPLDSSSGREYVLRRPPRVLLLTRFIEVSPAWIGEFWRALRQEVEGVSLLVAGKAMSNNGEWPFLRALSVTGAHTEQCNVAWLGYVEPDELPTLFSSVDCAVFPSQDTKLHRAKCSVRLANVLQHGLPAIASAVGAQEDYGGDGAAALLPADSTPVEFAEETARILRSYPVRQTYGERAAKRMNTEYAWPVFGQMLSDFYGQVLNDERPR